MVILKVRLYCLSHEDHWGIEGKGVSQYCVQGEQPQHLRCIAIVCPLTSVGTAGMKITEQRVREWS